MTAVEETTIQTVIDSVASDNGMGDNPEEKPEEQNPNEDPNKGDDSNLDDGQGAGEEDNPQGDDDAKQAQAFAAMRVELKKLRDENAALKEAQNPTPEVKPEETVNPLAIKDTDSEEVKLLKAELAAIKETTTELKEDRTTRINQEQQARMVGELTQLRDTYKLDRQGLLDFADDAEKAGFILGQTPLTVEQVYKVVYHDKLVANAMKTVEANTNEDVAPGSGPGGTNPSGKETMSVKDMVGSVIKDLKLE